MNHLLPNHSRRQFMLAESMFQFRAHNTLEVIVSEMPVHLRRNHDEETRSGVKSICDPNGPVTWMGHRELFENQNCRLKRNLLRCLECLVCCQNGRWFANFSNEKTAQVSKRCLTRRARCAPGTMTPRWHARFVLTAAWGAGS